MFSGNMDAIRYGEILKASLLPFIGNVTQRVIDYTRIMTPNIPADIFPIFLKPMVLSGGKVHRNR